MFVKGFGYFFSGFDEKERCVCLSRLTYESKLNHKIHFLIFLEHNILIFENFLLRYSSHIAFLIYIGLIPSPFRQLKLNGKERDFLGLL